MLVPYLKQPWKDFAGFSCDDLREGFSVERSLGADVDGSSTGLASPMDEVGRWIHVARSANHHHQRGFFDLALDAAHFKRHFPKEDDMRTQAAAARASANLVEAGVDCAVFDGRRSALVFAA